MEYADPTYIQPPITNEDTFVANNQPADRTMTVQSVMVGDATFVSQDPAFNRGEPNNETFCMPAASSLTDETVILEKASKMPKQTSMSSIMTEDDSDDEIPLHVLSKKPNNELFK